MAGASLSSYNAVFKTVYARDIVETLNSKIDALKLFRRAQKEAWEGLDVLRWPLRVGRNEGFAYGQLRGPIAEPSHQSHVQIQVPLRYSWGRIELDSGVLKQAKTNRGAFKKVMQIEMDGLIEDMLDDENRIIWGDGRGVLALINGACNGTTTINVDSPGGVAGSDNGARFLQKDQKVAIISSSGDLLAVRQVASISPSGSSITVNANVSAAEGPDNAFLVRAPNLNVTSADDTAYNKEPMGLLGMIDDGTYVNNYFGINRTTYPTVKAPVISNVGALDLDTIQQGCDVAEQLGNGVIQHHCTHHSVRRAYLALLTANRLYISSGGTNSHDGGFAGAAGPGSEPTYAGKPVYVDKDAPYGTWFGFDPRYFIEFTNTPGEWVEEDGTILRMRQGYDIFEAVWRRFGNYGCEKPSASFRLDGITANLVVIHVR